MMIDEHGLWIEIRAAEIIWMVCWILYRFLLQVRITPAADAER
jgi:hypothetical protein